MESDVHASIWANLAVRVRAGQMQGLRVWAKANLRDDAVGRDAIRVHTPQRDRFALNTPLDKGEPRRILVDLVSVNRIGSNNALTGCYAIGQDRESLPDINGESDAVPAGSKMPPLVKKRPTNRVSAATSPGIPASPNTRPSRQTRISSTKQAPRDKPRIKTGPNEREIEYSVRHWMGNMAIRNRRSKTTETLFLSWCVLAFRRYTHIPPRT